MITILSLLISGIVTNIPILIKLIDKVYDRRHEKELLQLKHELKKERMNFELDIVNSIAAAREGENLRYHDSLLDGGRFLNTLRASIRPVLTYLFFGVFVAIKLAVLGDYMASTDTLDAIEIWKLVWDDQTSAVFGAIMGFWFGGRAIEKYMKF